MLPTIFIGVDGGASKSTIRIEDREGQLLGQATAGPSSIRLSIDESWKTLLQAIATALQGTGISLHDKNYHFHAGMGLAGSEVSEAYAEFISRPHPFKTLKVDSDAHIACLGAHGGKDGAIIIVGTGAIGYQIEAGKNNRVGGWGFPQDDEGSGAWLGLEAARLTFQWLDHRIEKSLLVEDVFDFFNEDFEKLVSWSNRANSSEFARLAPIVIHHVEQNEATAIRLIKQAASAIDHIGHTLEKIRVNRQEKFQLALLGGIAPFIEPFLSVSLRPHLVSRQADATVGAIKMIRQEVMRA